MRLLSATSIAAVLIAIISSGCASKNVAYVESMAGAESAIKEAQSSTATIHAPLDLKLAEDKLSAANAAVKKEEFVEAKRLADEALVDAKLAEAKSLSEKAKKRAREMRDSVEALRQEIQRKQVPQK
jgi:hypothetical protein